MEGEVSAVTSQVILRWVQPFVTVLKTLLEPDGWSEDPVRGVLGGLG